MHFPFRKRFERDVARHIFLHQKISICWAMDHAVESHMGRQAVKAPSNDQASRVASARGILFLSAEVQVISVVESPGRSIEERKAAMNCRTPKI
jgi:hypothetical protein